MNTETLLNALTEIDILVLAASFVLLFSAQPISRWLNDDEGLAVRTSMMRALNFLIIAAVLLNVLLLHRYAMLEQITYCLIVIYFAVVLTQIINFFVRLRFGKRRITNNHTLISDTYSSRGLSLFVTAFVSVIAVVSCLRILGLNSLLEAGGAIGIIGLFLAMTQASWAPDIVAGLIILNSRMCEEGDVVQFKLEGDNIVATIFKTKLFHTECLDLANNHRLMVRNAKLRDCGVQNLSRFASARGLRECMLFNIDYKHTEHEVTEMITRAFTKIDEQEGTREEQYQPEIRVYETGDYAVTWAVYYYIKDVKQILQIKQVYRAHVLAEATRSGISLATPDLQQNEVINSTP
ncbi:MAG: mechanosensitive ion channel family protein [Pseudomonadota bacterium]